MARITSGAFDSISGGFGGIVVSSWRGVRYVKAAHGSRTKNISEKELANRQKFKVAQLFLRPLVHFVRIGFAGYSDRSFGFVAAKSHLLKHAMEGDPANPVINPALVKFSYGSLPLPDSIVVSKIEPDTIEFSWDLTSTKGSLFDQAMMVAYDFEKQKCLSFTHGEMRKAGKTTLRVASGYNYHLYLAFVAHDRSRQSDSIYLGQMSF